VTTGHDASEYGRHVGSRYDEIYDGVFDTDGAVECLLALAGGGAVLEFGVGTGRLAIPLAAAGLPVHGVDGSAAMLDTLRAKPGGDRVACTLGDFAEVTVPGEFAVVALTFNTVFALPDQAAQVRCFHNAARHLQPGGRFVVEAWVPDQARSPGPTLRPRRLAQGLAGLVIEEHDPVQQLLCTTQIVLGGSFGVHVYPVVHRYAFPSELDLMAQLAGLEPEHRWATWRRDVFGPQSESHVSVYRKAGHG
jgi:SAM-dependent methyltransferase